MQQKKEKRGVRVLDVWCELEGEMEKEMPDEVATEMTREVLSYISGQTTYMDISQTLWEYMLGEFT